MTAPFKGLLITDASALLTQVRYKGCMMIAPPKGYRCRCFTDTSVVLRVHGDCTPQQFLMQLPY